MSGVEEDGRDWGLFARAAVAGAGTALGVFLVLLAGGWDAFRASEIAFSLAGLPFSLGLIGWSTVILSGSAIEGFSRELGLSAGWSAESGRQVMALLIAFGGGGMVVASVVSVLVAP